MGLGDADGEIEIVEKFAFAEDVYALGLQVLAHDGVLSYETDVFDWTDIENRGGKIQMMAVLAELFEEGIGGLVVALSGMVHDRYERAGEDKEVEPLLVQKSVVEVPSAFDLGCDYVLPLLQIHV